MKNKMKTGITLLGVGTFASTYGYVMKRFYNNVLSRDHSEALQTADHTNYSALNACNFKAKHEWLPTVEAQDVHIHSFDQLRLAARYFPNESHTWVVIVHGYRAKGLDMMHACKQFYEHGYQVLSVDCRGHGRSEGNYIGMGWHDRLDIISWIKYITSNDPEANIILYGVSMGASSVLMATGEELPKQVVCCVADCGYSSIKAIFQSQIERLYPYVPSAVLLRSVDVLCAHKAGYSIYEGNTLKQLHKSKTPTLFLHGKKDDFVPVEMAVDNYEACAAEKELLLVDEAGHGLSCLHKQYFERVFNFCENYIG